MTQNLGTTEDTFTPKELLMPLFPVMLVVITILSGVGTLVRGTVLGKILLGAASSAAKTGGNTGNGTLVLDATTPIRAKAQAGVYKVRIIRPAIAAIGETSPAMKALAQLKDPLGNILEIFEVPATPGVTIDNQIKFALLDGTTPFVLGDGFDITIAEGSLKGKAYNASNVDGSQEAALILAEDVDATSEDVVVSAYRFGHFNKGAITGLDTAATKTLEKKGIFISEIIN